MKLTFNREPVAWGGLVNIIPGILMLLGVQISSTELTSIFGSVTNVYAGLSVVIPLITAIIARHKVVPVKRLEEEHPQVLKQIEAADEQKKE